MKYLFGLMMILVCAGSFAQTWNTTGTDGNRGNQRYSSGMTGLGYTIRTSAGGGWAWQFTDMNNNPNFSVDFPTSITTITNSTTTYNTYTMLKLTGADYPYNHGLDLIFHGNNNLTSDPEFTYGGGPGSAAIVNFHNKPLTFATNNQGRMIIMGNGNVGIGTYNPGTYKLAVQGKIGALEINVTTSGWGDYVFDNDYKLPSLEEVERYIKNNHHLAEIPSAEEVKRDGIDVGKMNEILVKKIEELTLYIIDQEKRLSKLEKSNKN